METNSVLAKHVRYMTLVNAVLCSIASICTLLYLIDNPVLFCLAVIGAGIIVLEIFILARCLVKMIHEDKDMIIGWLKKFIRHDAK